LFADVAARCILYDVDQGEFSATLSPAVKQRWKKIEQISYTEDGRSQLCLMVAIFFHKKQFGPVQ